MAPAFRLFGKAAVALLAMTGIVSLGIGTLLGPATIPLAAAIVLAHGLPGAVLFLFIARRREVRFREAAAAGGLIGALPSQVYNLVTAVADGGWAPVLASARDPDAWLGEAAMVILLGGFGAMGGLVFLTIMRAGGGEPVQPGGPVQPDGSVGPGGPAPAASKP